MREINKEGALYLAAKEAARNLLNTLRSELRPITCGWADVGKEKYTAISWYNPENYDYQDFFGTEPGLYLCGCQGEALFWVPKTSAVFDIFYDKMIELHEEDDELLDSSIPSDIDIYFDGNSTIVLKVYACVDDRSDEKEYLSAKIIAEELMEMLENLEGFEPAMYFEGDDEGNSDPNEEHANYYVGFITKYGVYS